MLVCIAALGLLSSGGCKEPGSSVTYKVRGKVSLNGQPVKDMKVLFTPAKGRPADGLLDSSGNFDFLSTDKLGDGAVEGKHKVSLGVIQPVAKLAPGGTFAPKPYSGYPKKYASAATTDVEVTVSSTGENKLEITLNDNEPEEEVEKGDTSPPANPLGPPKASDANSQ
jgi:hypothetical protein